MTVIVAAGITQREKIIAQIKSILTGAGYYVTRKLLDYNDLSGAQLPAVSITNGLETNSPASMGDNLEGMWRPHLGIYIKSLTEDPQDVVERHQGYITRLLTADPTLSGFAEDIDLVAKDTDRGVFSPYAVSDMTFEIMYSFNRLTQGG